MSTILAYVDLTLVGYVAVFVATLVFSQKIKDFFAGVPSNLRSSLQSLEANVKTDVQAYQTSLIAKIAPAKPVVAAAPAPAPVAPVAPVAPAPAAPAAPTA